MRAARAIRLMVATSACTASLASCTGDVEAARTRGVIPSLDDENSSDAKLTSIGSERPRPLGLDRFRSTRLGITSPASALSGRALLSCPRFLWTPYCSEKLEDRQHGR